MPLEPAITFIRPEQLSRNAPYAYAANTGPLVFTAGACPLDADGNTVAVGDVGGQAHLPKVMTNLVTALQAAGAQLTDVVETTVYVASSQRADLSTARSVVRAAFGEHAASSTLIGVTVLGYDGQLVEVEAIAVLPQSSS